MPTAADVRAKALDPPGRWDLTPDAVIAPLIAVCSLIHAEVEGEPEAIERARTEHKPIFLSIGYSACHWCHVMAHECFEDHEVAAEMNRLFVNVKVDREERPDLDELYMSAVQAITGRAPRRFADYARDHRQAWLA